jgi:hypothetical protein
LFLDSQSFIVVAEGCEMRGREEAGERDESLKASRTGDDGGRDRCSKREGEEESKSGAVPRRDDPA